jgi:hypothetical protein
MSRLSGYRNQTGEVRIDNQSEKQKVWNNRTI